MERVNQIVRSGRVRGRLILLLVFGVLLALLVVGIAVMMQNQVDHAAAATVEQSDRERLDGIRPMLAVARLERAGAEDERFTPQPIIEITKPQESHDFHADYQRYQEITEQIPAPAPVSATEQARQALAQSRAQALLTALKASTAVDAASPKVAAPAPLGNAVAPGLAQGSAALDPLQSALAQEGVNALKGLNQGNGPMSPRTLSAYQSLAQGSTLLKEKVETVRSPYLLRQGVLIPCVLLSGVNSDLPGQVQAQVTRDVFDTPYGRHVLIPRGAKIIGQYASAPLMGQQRLMLGFNRVIFPDGKALSLGSMPGASLDGFSGFSAEVDNHMWRLFTNAVLLGGVTAGVSLAVDNDSYDSEGHLTLNGALSQGLGQSLGRVITSVIERNLTVSPTLTVAPGFLFNVTLTQDIYFDGPYHGYDYELLPTFSR